MKRVKHLLVSLLAVGVLVGCDETKTTTSSGGGNGNGNGQSGGNSPASTPYNPYYYNPTRPTPTPTPTPTTPVTPYRPTYTPPPAPKKEPIVYVPPTVPVPVPITPSGPSPTPMTSVASLPRIIGELVPRGEAEVALNQINFEFSTNCFLLVENNYRPEIRYYNGSCPVTGEARLNQPNSTFQTNGSTTVYWNGNQIGTIERFPNRWVLYHLCTGPYKNVCRPVSQGFRGVGVVRL